MKKTIAWEKWRDNEHYLEASQEMSESISTPLDEELEDEEEPLNLNVTMSVTPHIVRTPLGDFSVLDNMLPSKQFDCWIGHTNFPITYNELAILDDEIDGLDCVRVMSKYKVFIGIAKLFKFREVATQITEKLCQDAEIFSEKEVRNIMSQQPNVVHWAAVLLPNGGFEYITSSSEVDEEYEELLANMKKNHKNIIQG